MSMVNHLFCTTRSLTNTGVDEKPEIPARDPWATKDQVDQYCCEGFLDAVRLMTEISSRVLLIDA